MNTKYNINLSLVYAILSTPLYWMLTTALGLSLWWCIPIGLIWWFVIFCSSYVF